MHIIINYNYSLPFIFNEPYNTCIINYKYSLPPVIFNEPYKYMYN